MKFPRFQNIETQASVNAIKYVRKARHLRVGFAIGIASNTLQDLRLLVPRLEQSSASCSQQIGELRFYISRAMRIETTDMKLFRIRGQSYKEFLVYANEKTKILKIIQNYAS